MSREARSILAELIGTFTLVFMGTAVATLQGFMDGWQDTGWLAISFAFGGTLLVLVYAIGPVSGCHVNPAVTIAMALGGRLDWKRVPGYVIAQCVGAILASCALLALLKGLPTYDVTQHGLGANGNPTGMADASLIAWEVALTALFLFTIFSVTRSDATPGIQGLAIGGFLFLAHLVGAQFGDSSVNPARSLGPAVVLGGDALKVLWIFIVGPVAGGVLGWVLYRLTSAPE
jgi:aquaporin Z